jgi:hypothetical protein
LGSSETSSQLVRKEYMMRVVPWAESVRAVKLSSEFADLRGLKSSGKANTHGLLRDNGESDS